MNRFSAKTAHALGHYVYVLVDPRTEQVFYVGKGSGPTRPFSHLLAADDGARESTKTARIAEVRKANMQPRIDILRHGLDDRTAREVEAAVIDALGVHNLTNRNLGHDSSARGRLSARQAEGVLGGRPLDVNDIDEPAVLFYRREAFPEHRLYDETRQFWALSEARVRATNADGQLKYRLALAMRSNFVLEVFRILAWFPAGTTVSTRVYDPTDGKQRWEFVGAVAEEPVRSRYRNRSLLRDGKPLHATQIGFRYVD